MVLLYQDWLSAKGADGKTKKMELLESFCLPYAHDGNGVQEHIAAWMIALHYDEAAMSTGLADFDDYCRKIYEEEK